MPDRQTNPNPAETVFLQTAEGVLKIQLRVERSVRSRVMRLSINLDGEVVLKIPPRQSLQSASVFLSKQSEWIRERLKRLPKRTTLLEHFTAFPYVSAYNRSYSMHIASTSIKPSLLFFPTATEVCMRVREDTLFDSQAIPLLRDLASKVIPVRTLELAKQFNIKIKHVSMRDQKTRWGSCSTSGTISLNWRLVLLEPALHDHIILHELAHTLEMNHSARYYKVLGQMDANSDKHSKAIDQVSRYLMSLGRKS